MKEDIKTEAEKYFATIQKEKIDKLLKVGFTQEQAEILVEMFQTAGFGLGLF